MLATTRGEPMKQLTAVLCCSFALACSSEESSSGSTGGSGGSGGSAGTGGSSGSAGTSGSAGSGAAGEGIAAKYPGDQGIANDPNVIFADDFESYGSTADLSQRWDNVFQLSQTRIASETDHVHAGSKALEFTLPQQDSELANAVQKVLTNELDAIYVRYYSKFDPSFDVIGSSHNGGGASAHYFVNGQATPGIPADGTNKFLIDYEHWRGEASTASPGLINVYIYHPLQRDVYGDHFFPSGMVLPNSSLPFDFGPEFVSRPDFAPELNRWYCYEFMLKANTVGELDGRVTLWLDGELIADFPNLRLRDIDSLKIDRFQLSLHAGSNPAGETRKWYDDVVAATAYIGPMVSP